MLLRVGRVLVRPVKNERRMSSSGPCMKIFQIGFNKCGTRTLHSFFERNGVPSVHWAQGTLALRILRNLLEGSAPVAGFEEYVFFSDMEASTDRFFVDAYKLFPFFHQHYPNAVFILNTRPRDAWLRSRLNHHKGEYAVRHMRLLKLESEAALRESWVRDWDMHHGRVRTYFAACGGRLIDFDIERDGPQKLVEGIPELALDAGKYELIGQTDRRPPDERAAREASDRDPHSRPGTL